MSRGRQVALACALVLPVLLVFQLAAGCGFDTSLYEQRPATTEPRCGEANDDRCEP